MWIYTKSRGEHDKRFLLNLSLCSRINISQLGERWFLEVMQGNDTLPIAAVGSQEEAEKLLHQIYEQMLADRKAMDLDNPEGPKTDRHDPSSEADRSRDHPTPRQDGNTAPALREPAREEKAVR